MLDLAKRFMRGDAAVIVAYVMILAFYVFLLVTGAPLEKSVPTLLLLMGLYILREVRALASGLSEMQYRIPWEYRKTQMETRGLVIRYFSRLIQFLQASDILKQMYCDGLLYDPDYAAKDGKLTVNLPDGTALIVKDRGYPMKEPGLYVNLRDPADNEFCVVRVEFSTAAGLRIIAYQHDKDAAVVDIPYIPTEGEQF